MAPSPTWSVRRLVAVTPTNSARSVRAGRVPRGEILQVFQDMPIRGGGGPMGFIDDHEGPVGRPVAGETFRVGEALDAGDDGPGIGRRFTRGPLQPYRTVWALFAERAEGLVEQLLSVDAEQCCRIPDPLRQPRRDQRLPGPRRQHDQLPPDTSSEGLRDGGQRFFLVIMQRGPFGSIRPRPRQRPRLSHHRGEDTWQGRALVRNQITICRGAVRSAARSRDRRRPAATGRSCPRPAWSSRPCAGERGVGSPASAR